MNKDEQTFYSASANLPFMSSNNQDKLAKAKVLVIGAGGLGSPCLVTLTNMGVGLIGIADFDVVEYSNLQRQTIYNVDDIGKQKAIVAEKYLNRLNPHIKIKTHNVKIEIDNILAIIKSYDIIVDGTDNFITRYIINDACIVMNKPLVYGAVHQSEGHFTVFNYNHSGTLRCLFPEHANTLITESCSDRGVYLVITQLLGVYMANEIIKIILSQEHISFNLLNCINPLTLAFQSFKYQKYLNSDLNEQQFYENHQSFEITVDDILKRKNNSESIIKWIDVRENFEFNTISLDMIHIPHSKFSTKIIDNYLNVDGVLVVFVCNKGFKSIEIVKNLRKRGKMNVFSLKNGLKNTLNDIYALKNL